MLDAILLPIGEGNRILAQISSGKIDELIAQTYKGDHEKMKQAINNVGFGSAGPAERTGPADRRLQGGTTLRSRQAGAVPGRVCRNCAGRECHAGRDSAAHRRRQSNPGADLQWQDRRVIAQTYKGDHEKMKQAVNNVGSVLQGCRRNWDD